jgi:O-antigen/teichoic acid export membrane protein
MPLSLRTNFVWTLAGNVVFAASQWTIIAMIAKLGTSEMVGQYVLGLAVGAPVFLLLNMQLRSVQVTDAHSRYDFEDYFSLRLITVIVGAGIIIVFSVISSYGHSTLMVIIALTAAKVSESLSDISYGHFQKKERMDWIATSLMLRGLLGAATIVCILWLTNHLDWATFGLAVTWILILLFYDRKQLLSSEGRVVFPPRLENSLRLTRTAAPLGIVMLLISLNVNLPRYFVEYYWNAEQLGYFGAISYVAVAASTIVYALGQASSARLALYGVEKRAKFVALISRLLAFSIAIGLFGVAVAVLWGQQLLSALYSPDYSRYYIPFRWIMVGTAFEYIASTCLYGITALQAYKVQVPGYAIIVLLKAYLCYLWIPTLGVTGAAYASVAVGVTQLLIWLSVLSWLLLKRNLSPIGQVNHYRNRVKPLQRA